jgi:hypothetical protein
MIEDAGLAHEDVPSASDIAALRLFRRRG